MHKFVAKKEKHEIVEKLKMQKIVTKCFEESFAKQARRIRVLRRSFLQNGTRRLDGAFCNMGEEKGSFAKWGKEMMEGTSLSG